MNQDDIVDALAGISLFADLDRPQLRAVAHTFNEQSFAAGQRILRQGFAGGGFAVILDGEVAVRIDGQERVRLGKGDFFGEMALLLGDTPVADVVAVSPLRVLELAGPDLKGFLVAHPPVMYRMLQSVARRLRNANRQGA